MPEPEDRTPEAKEEDPPEVVAHSAEEEELPDCGCHLAVNSEE